ncbi:hypothetical protein [Embleya scabrispora]|uniref:hypothetical protein n=1 Tax=Embleya scabrispora TaxID=159449 RepID=UPI00038179A3|nr:hypothetical protein [Embleya scabrispora]MYS81004.1 hypothetical protein [Streptomyces sp. SID5474]
MIEYELYKSRQQELLAGADRDRLVMAALRSRRAAAKARRAERAAHEVVQSAAAIESVRMRRNLQLLTR